MAKTVSLSKLNTLRNDKRLAQAFEFLHRIKDADEDSKRRLHLDPFYKEMEEVRGLLESVETTLWGKKAEGTTEGERLTEEILDVILALASLDFTKTVEVGFEDSHFNAVAVGLNMLGQELERSVVSKESLEKEVAQRTRDLSTTNRLLNIEIDEKKRAEAEALAREQKYRNIFESTAVSLWEIELTSVIDFLRETQAEQGGSIRHYLDGEPKLVQRTLQLAKVIDVNKATVQMFEADGKKHAMQSLDKIFTGEMFGVIKEAFARILEGKSKYESETTALSLKGKELHVLFQISVPPKENGAVNALISIIDMSEQFGLEEQLRQSQKMEAVGRLAGGVAHDFNNLLTVIINFGQMVVDGTEDNPGLHRKSEAIVECAERAASLTKQLLAFSRRQVIAPQQLKLNDVITNMESMLARLLGEDVFLKTIICEDLWQVRADNSQLEQIIMNLAVNARDAMPKGGDLIVETHNVILDENSLKGHGGVKPGEYAMFSVKDQGTGIPKEIREKIFEPFFTTKGVGEGTGLGLSTVYGNIRQNDGYIIVESEMGQGTTFKVYLPRSEEEETVSKGPVQVKKIKGGSETVLLVEDEESVREVASAVLKESGYTIIEACDGEEGLEKSRGHAGHIDLMITDVVMPKMNGKDLADKLATIRPDMKVIFMSGYTGTAVTHHGILENVNAFIQKPFRTRAFLSKVRDILDGVTD